MVRINLYTDNGGKIAIDIDPTLTVLDLKRAIMENRRRDPRFFGFLHKARRADLLALSDEQGRRPVDTQRISEIIDSTKSFHEFGVTYWDP